MTQSMFTIYFSWWGNQVENFRVPTTSAKVKEHLEEHLGCGTIRMVLFNLNYLQGFAQLM